MQPRTGARLVEMRIPTADGEFVARYSPAGLCELRFPDSREPVSETRAENLPSLVREWHALTVKALAIALAGGVPKILPPLDLSAGTDFQRRVWTAMRKIAAGKTQSYGDLASALGRPKAVRAVGGACGANPIPVFVPCHRVLAAHGKLGGFSGGLEWKRKLLTREGVEDVCSE
jgi:O-6-methylguanine DNA methyltransferase